MRQFPFALSALAVAFSLGACSAQSDESKAGGAPVDAAEEIAASDALPRPAENGSAAAAAPVSTRVLSLEGLGDLRIGQAVPQGSSWAERGAQISDECRTVSSPEYPGVYAIVADGKVRRITLGQRSDVQLAEGYGVGASEADVREDFAGFREEPHKYVDPPAKYLTAPNAASGDPALRFEIGEDGKVSLIHVGTMPVLTYVEGCA